MGQPKTSQPSAPIVSAREQQLLDDFQLLKSQGEKVTIAGFARRNGYANKSALRHFPVLRRELSDYVARFSAASQKRQGSLEIKFLESQIERQSRKIERLETQVKTIPQLKARIVRLEAGKEEDSRKKRLLRAMLSTVISFLSSSDFAKARDLSARLEKQAKALMEDAQDDLGSSGKG
ncbi:MAG TPA: hypothetical protein VFX97_01580 [Pyrinomonadaceae bacterium]|nr:hypothetical protein [Pyrinomonadaceae bacterium]